MDWDFILGIDWPQLVANIRSSPDERLPDLVTWFDEPKTSEEREHRKDVIFTMWERGWREMSLGDIESPPDDDAYHQQRMFELIVAGFAKAEQYRRKRGPD